jgi:very-short-patch-repair endonuclease
MRTDDLDARIALVAARQGGAFTFAQALAVGFSRGTVSRRLRAGRWRRVHPGVYVQGGAPDNDLQRLWCALLAVGPSAVLSHETAARLHGASFPLEPVTCTVAHGGHHRLPGVFAHQIDDLAARHRTQLHGLPVTTAARAVVELGATQPLAVVDRIADVLVHERRTTFAAIASVLRDVARPGKPGIEKVARVLDERGDGYVPPASELERALREVLRAGGLPEPDAQVPLPGRGGLRGLVDFAYADARMVLETDGRRWHQRLQEARRDRERDAQVVRAGWVPLRFVHEQVMDDPAEVVAVIADTRSVRLQLLGHTTPEAIGSARSFSRP